ncbi:MAG: TonB-dependent receptor, partial [Kangiellaceae bacterium]|nr:TonB-dependent receptor [Kangiellaceae bacterium]
MNNKFKPLLISGLVSTALGTSNALANTTATDEANETTMIITATRLPREAEDIAGTVTKIESEELEKQLAEDFDDVIRYQPGLSMRRVARGGNQGFTIRGMSGKRVLMLLDGVKSSDIYPAGSASYGNENYELEDIKSFEIIRGPASALYGSDALGGVVLMKSKDPIDYIENDGEVYTRLNVSTADANELKKFGFTLAGTNNKLQYMMQVNRRDFAEQEVNGEGSLSPQDGNSTGALFKLVYQVNDANKWSFVVDNFKQEIDYNLTDPSAPELPYLGLDDGDRTRFSISHDWDGDTAFADRIESKFYAQTGDALQHTSQMRNTSYSFDYAPFGNNTATLRVSDFEFNQEVTGFATTIYKTIESGSTQHSMVYGVTYDVVETERPRNRCETDTATQAISCNVRAYPMAPAEEFPNKTFPDTETTRIGIFFQDEIVLGESGFTLIPGMRFDKFEMDAKDTVLQNLADLGFQIESTDESEVSKNLGLIYDLGETSSLFFQYAEGFRAPSYDEANQAYVNLAYGYGTVPNPDLKPETSKGYEIGYKSRIGKNFIALAFYNNDFEDFISSNFIGVQNGVNLFQDSNVGEVNIYGAEFTGIWTLNDSWKIRSSIAYSKGKDETTNTDLNEIDPLSAVVGASY